MSDTLETTPQGTSTETTTTSYQAYKEDAVGAAMDAVMAEKGGDVYAKIKNTQNTNTPPTGS